MLFLVFFNSRLEAQEYDITENIAQVERLFLIEKEALSTNAVTFLASNVIKQRHLYSADIVAKVFILLANTASNNGELSKAIQFAENGLAIVGIHDSLKIDLLLSLISGHYIEGRFNPAYELSQEAVNLARTKTTIKHLLIALSYSAMSNALIANHEKAYQELQEVEQLLTDNHQFNDHIDVIEIIALAYLYQQDFTTAKTLYDKAITLRFESDKREAIGRSYYYLATINLKLNRLDDAYSGFYQAKQQALDYRLPVRIALANLGLGKVSLRQKNSKKALKYLEEAELQLSHEPSSGLFLSVLIALANAHAENGDQQAFYTTLQRAENLAKNIDVSYDQIMLYPLLVKMYVEQKKYQLAFKVSEKHMQLYEKHYLQKAMYMEKITRNSFNLQNRQVALNVAIQSDLKQSYYDKYQEAKNIIYFLLILLVGLLVLSLSILFAQRTARMNQVYEDIERPEDFIASAAQTKRIYQLNYKKARKFEYMIAIGYLSIDNWQELAFKFNKKTVNEVAKSISILINRHMSEFDYAGLINDGEYLFLSPHQNKESLSAKLNLLSTALNTHFFANLGDFSIKISYSFESPSVKDIDPFIFLARLSESKRMEYLNFPNERN